MQLGDEYSRKVDLSRHKLRIISFSSNPFWVMRVIAIKLLCLNFWDFHREIYKSKHDKAACVVRMCPMFWFEWFVILINTNLFLSLRILLLFVMKSLINGHFETLL